MPNIAAEDIATTIVNTRVFVVINVQVTTASRVSNGNKAHIISTPSKDKIMLGRLFQFLQ